MRDFADKTVIVTGASGGLGAELVSLFSSRGARVVACDAVEPLPSNAGVAARYVFDLLDVAATAEAVTALTKAEGIPDVVINNAGWTRAESVAQLDASQISREVDLNLTGVMRFTNPLARAMAESGRGSIVFVSSVNAIAHFGNPAYAAAKAGINAYARALAVELGRNGVRANVVCPGSMRTPAWDHRLEREPEIMLKMKGLYPLGRIVDVGEVASAIAFLASDRASGISGAVLPVDAGLTAGQLPFVTEVLGA
jgi:NAD(P)-dependent dehydrogenase (short-subunit alcohol dehydrogenase family)